METIIMKEKDYTTCCCAAAVTGTIGIIGGCLANLIVCPKLPEDMWIMISVCISLPCVSGLISGTVGFFTTRQYLNLMRERTTDEENLMQDGDNNIREDIKFSLLPHLSS